jgi:hypothetical protein
MNLNGASEAFIYYCLSRVLKLDDGELGSLVTDGQFDRGIDAVYIEEKQDGPTIHLFQMKCYKEFKPNDRNFPSSELEKILSFLDDLLSKSDGMEKTCNGFLFSKVKDIWGVILEEPCSIVVHLCTNAQGLEDKYVEPFKANLRRKGELVSFEEHDIDRLSYIEMGSRKVEKDISVKLFEEQNFERTDGAMRGLIGTIKAEEFIRFLTDQNTGNIDENLFNENIRLYLGEKNEVNSKIYNSAVSGGSSEFWYLNNGITIVCDSYKYNTSQSDAPVRIKNPQIVNGGQTSFSLYEASKAAINSINKVRVLIKIIETDDIKFRARIAEATNSQTMIRSRDLRSNDEIQLKLEDTLKDYGYFYERKRNQYFDVLYSKKIDAHKAGQVIYSYYHQEPQKAKAASEKVFGEYYDTIFDPKVISAEKVLVCYGLYMDIEKRKEQVQSDMKSNMKPFYSEAWLVEGGFYVLYMVSVLCERESIALDNYDECKNKIDEAMDLIGSFVNSHSRASAYRLFRSADTKERIRNFRPAEQIELPLEKTSAA